MMKHTKYQGSSLGLVVTDKKIFKTFISKSIFSPCDLDMQRTGTICIIIKEGHIRIFLAKFGKNPASSLGDVL